SGNDHRNATTAAVKPRQPVSCSSGRIQRAKGGSLKQKINTVSAVEQLAADTDAELPVRLLDLVTQFDQAVVDGSSGDDNETTVRETFLNPLLEELGWDPRNRRGVKNTERDVILEDSVMVDGMMKAPDYAFVIEGRRRFFVEAKRPSINVKSGKSSAHQIRRYCWSAGIPFGVLTNFKEFAVYDCRAIPSPTDSAATGRVAYFTYKDLVANWPLLYTMFGKQ